ncbi:ubiquinol-cytochrome c reductase iron-sulfur subunit [Geoalkalibacter halelectricus]|uniref:Rieske 2Fe-2S domain-containing protein n=1 Tax=Geoalkalibacter halelectricus TaxID=2847045 RepID=A0ABY5ZTN2_9BACT|nr:Rieske 2Fe-2S domain-containing protein [Geoalkalibacter halelectricus]MDO3379902.1 Rieske 2Fe-2S domain-containing protein [Geoalkalibacter halelectricus]UWZ80571.1 Rieske 2Fe-2S domain-containing protein [Geoalkalibacter halelectricus]
MTRRQWLFKVVVRPGVAATGALLGAILLDVWLAAGRFTSLHWTEATSLDTLPEDAVLSLPAKRLALVRDRDRVAALSLECTHLGCLVNTVEEGFFCPCHGSEFGPRGEVHSGPAPRDLDWLPLRVHRERLWVQAGTRLAEPAWVSLPANAADAPQGNTQEGTR